jgi:hypothetical protein
MSESVDAEVACWEDGVPCSPVAEEPEVFHHRKAENTTWAVEGRKMSLSVGEGKVKESSRLGRAKPKKTAQIQCTVNKSRARVAT